MATCMCGAEVVWRELQDGSRVAFDAHEVGRGEGRYVEGPDGLVPVAPTQDVMAWQLHAESCPRQ
jgi:hypothetical protein